MNRFFSLLAAVWITLDNNFFGTQDRLLTQRLDGLKTAEFDVLAGTLSEVVDNGDAAELRRYEPLFRHYNAELRRQLDQSADELAGC